MNVLDLASHHVSLKRVSTHNGGEYHGPCPGCGDGGKGKKSNRFHVWPEENHGAGSYWCRQCGKAGDGIQFLRDFENLSFKAACERLGKEPPRFQPFKSPTIPKKKRHFDPYTPPPMDVPPTPLWMEKAEKFVAWATNTLLYIPATNRQPPADPAAAACYKWLMARGVNEIDMQHFRLGWNPGANGKDLFRHRESWGLEPELKHNGTPKRLWLPQGLVIPNRKAGRITRLRIRRPEGDPRYYVIPGSGMDCMTIKNIPGRPAYTIVESELDQIMINNEAGDLTGTVALGNSSRKPDFRTWHMLKDARILLIALDTDKAGKDASEWWLEQFPTAKMCPAPKGKDPGEAYQAGVDIRAWIQSELPEGWFI